MKKINKKLLTLVVSTLALSVSANQAPKAQDNSILCDLFGISCPTVTTKGAGNGKEPPKSLAKE